MKNSNTFVVVLISLLLFSCDRNDLEPEEATVFQFEATVIGQGIDCGDVYLVDLRNNTGNPEITDGRYYANHLSLNYKLNGLEIELNCRFLYDDEIRPCTMMGPTYPHISVLEVQAKE